MTTIDQQIAIATAFGWTHPDVPTQTGLMHPPNCHGRGLDCPPQYAFDLNAMAEARRALLGTVELRHTFQTHLEDVLAKRLDEVTDFDLLNSTAAEQAEALVRALNFWKETT